MLCMGSTYVTSIIDMFLPSRNEWERGMIDQNTSSSATSSNAAPAVVNAQDAEILKLNAEILMLEKELEGKRRRIGDLVAGKEKKAAEQAAKMAEGIDIELSLKRDRCLELFQTLSKKTTENNQRGHRIETLKYVQERSEANYNALVKSEIYNVAFQIGIYEGSKSAESVQKVEVLKKIKAKLETQPENVTNCDSLTSALKEVQKCKKELEKSKSEFQVTLEEIRKLKDSFVKLLVPDDSKAVDIKLLKALLNGMDNSLLRDFFNFLIRERFFEIAKAVVDCDFGIEDKHKLRCLDHNEFPNIVFEQTSSGELEASKVSELSRLLVSINLFSKRLGFTSPFVRQEGYVTHQYLHLFFAANYNIGQIFQSTFKKGLLEIGVNGATTCDMTFIDRIFNICSVEVTRLMSAFASNLHNCFGLFQTVHAIQQLPIETPDQLKALSVEGYRMGFLIDKPVDKYSIAGKAISGQGTTTTFITTDTLSQARSHRFVAPKSTSIIIDMKTIKFGLVNDAMPKLITL